MRIAPQDGLTYGQRSYRKLKNDPERYAKHLKRCKQEHVKYRAKLLADPVRYAAYKARHRDYVKARRTRNPQADKDCQKRSRKRMMVDPVRYAKHQVRCKRAQDRYLAKIRADPERYAIYLKKCSVFNARQYAKRREVRRNLGGIVAV